MDFIPLYFVSVLLTAILTGWLAFYAYRRPALPGVRAYAWCALFECLIALTEAISMLSSTPTQALFWFNLRFAFAATIPVLWLDFALAYSGQKDGLSKRLFLCALIMPAITQVMVWSNLRGLWVEQQVDFHQVGWFWIADTSVRIPGLWFMVYTFYSASLLFVGSIFLLSAAWRMRWQYRGQALLLVLGMLVSLLAALIPAFNLFPQAEFNPFVPGMGIGVLLIALAIFRFRLFKRPIAHRNMALLAHLDAQEQRSLAVLFSAFILFASGISATAYMTYQHFEKQFRTQAENNISTVADLGSLPRWCFLRYDRRKYHPRERTWRNLRKPKISVQTQLVQIMGSCRAISRNRTLKS